jgi:hypothetical protein
MCYCSLFVLWSSRTPREKPKKCRLFWYPVEHVGPRLQFHLAPFLKARHQRSAQSPARELKARDIAGSSAATSSQRRCEKVLSRDDVNGCSPLCSSRCERGNRFKLDRITRAVETTTSPSPLNLDHYPYDSEDSLFRSSELLQEQQ